jgi:glycosyltransferase involved in cell wall biosynthesis
MPADREVRRDGTPLRVLIAGDNFAFPEGQGATTRVRAMGRGLVRAGADVDVVATTYMQWAGDGVGDLAASGVIDGMHYRHATGAPVAGPSRVRRRWGRLRGVGSACGSALGLGAPAPDAVIFFTNDRVALTLAVGGAAKLRRSVLLLDGCELPFVYRQDDARTRAARAAYDHGFLNLYDGILAISGVLEDHFRRRVGSGTRVLRMPILVDCERFARGGASPRSAAAPYIAYSGSLAYTKGITTLLHAFRDIAGRHPDMSLRITGLGVPREYRGELERLVCEFGLGGRVEFLGLIPGAEFPDFLRAATALVIPHPAADFSAAAFPTKLGEYLASGTPVVVTRVGEVEDYVTDGDTAFVADPGDPQALAAALDAVLGDRQRAAAVGAAGAALAWREFDIGRQGRRLCEFIEELRAKKLRRCVGNGRAGF